MDDGQRGRMFAKEQNVPTYKNVGKKWKTKYSRRKDLMKRNERRYKEADN